MRKWLCALLLTGCLAFCLPLNSLAAADLILPGAGGVYDVAYQNGTVAGGRYTLMAVSGTETSYSVSDASTVYIDQATAGSDGVHFSFIPRLTVPTVLLLYGEFSGGVASPVMLGVIRPAALFTDIKGSWAEDSINYMAGHGYMTGIGADSFGPDGTMTRAMLVTVLYRIEAQPKVRGTAAFLDAVPGDWYSDAVLWAVQNKIVTGYSETLFGTNDAVTREQLASILYRYATVKGYDISTKADLGGFIDAFKIASWAQDAVAWANAKGILSGSTSVTLVPGDPASRAQVAAMLTRFMKNVAI